MEINEYYQQVLERINMGIDCSPKSPMDFAADQIAHIIDADSGYCTYSTRVKKGRAIVEAILDVVNDRYGHLLEDQCSIKAVSTEEVEEGTPVCPSGPTIPAGAIIHVSWLNSQQYFYLTYGMDESGGYAQLINLNASKDVEEIDNALPIYIDDLIELFVQSKAIYVYQTLQDFQNGNLYVGKEL